MVPVSNMMGLAYVNIYILAKSCEIKLSDITLTAFQTVSFMYMKVYIIISGNLNTREMAITLPKLYLQTI